MAEADQSGDSRLVKDFRSLLLNGKSIQELRVLCEGLVLNTFEY